MKKNKKNKQAQSGLRNQQKQNGLSNTASRSKERYPQDEYRDGRNGYSKTSGKNGYAPNNENWERNREMEERRSSNNYSQNRDNDRYEDRGRSIYGDADYGFEYGNSRRSQEDARNYRSTYGRDENYFGNDRINNDRDGEGHSENYELAGSTGYRDQDYRNDRDRNYPTNSRNENNAYRRNLERREDTPNGYEQRSLNSYTDRYDRSLNNDREYGNRYENRGDYNENNSRNTRNEDRDFQPMNGNQRNTYRTNGSNYNGNESRNGDERERTIRTNEKTSNAKGRNGSKTGRGNSVSRGSRNGQK